MSSGRGISFFFLVLLSLLVGCGGGTDGQPVVDDSDRRALQGENADAIPEAIIVAAAKGPYQIGASYNLSATANYSDGSTRAITTEASWTIDIGEGTIDADGLFTAGAAAGITIVHASYNGVVGSIQIDVTAPQGSGASPDVTPTDETAPTIDRVVVNPENTRVVAGSVFGINVTAIYSDGSSANVSEEVNWKWDNVYSSFLSFVTDSKSQIKSEKITKEREVIELTGTLAGYADEFITHVTLEYANTISFSYNSKNFTYSEVIGGQVVVSSFYDQTGATALQYGSAVPRPGMVVRYHSSALSADEIVVLVFDQKDSLSFAYFKTWVSGVGANAEVVEYLWYPELSYTTGATASVVATPVNIDREYTGEFSIPFCNIANIFNANCSSESLVAGSFQVIRGTDAEVITVPVTATADDLVLVDNAIEIPVETTLFKTDVHSARDYQFVLEGTDVVMSLTGFDNCQFVTSCFVPAINNNPEQLRSLQFEIQPLVSGTLSYTIQVVTESPSGSLAQPVIVGDGAMRYAFDIQAGTSHYYKTSVNNIYDHWLTLRGPGSALAGMRMSLYSDANYTTPINACENLSDFTAGCAINKNTGVADVFVKLDNVGSDPFSGWFGNFYNEEGSPDSAVILLSPVEGAAPVPVTGQVGPEHATVSNANEPKGSFYGFSAVTGAYYEVALTGVENPLSLWINSGSGANGSAKTSCSFVADRNDDISCIFKSEAAWVSLNILLSGNTVGTSYDLSLRRLAADEKVYQVNILDVINGATIGWPYVSVFTKDGTEIHRRKFISWENKIVPGFDLVDFIIPSGDDHVFIRVTDIFNNGDQYAVKVTPDTTLVPRSAFEENVLDASELTNNDMTGAEPLLLDQVSTVNKFTAQPDGRVDTDWFKFCATPATCGL